MSNVVPQLPSKDGEPAWEAAYLHPRQGHWSEDDFLRIHTHQMAELVDGRLEILPTPNLKHQRILRLLLGLVEDAMPLNATALFAPLPSRLFARTIREPDLLYIAPEHTPAEDQEYPTKLDLVIEIVSEGTEARRRDYEEKRRDYAKAGIAEYWIVDPRDEIITVLVLQDAGYAEQGRFSRGDVAGGKLLGNLSVDVDRVTNA